MRNGVHLAEVDKWSHYATNYIRGELDIIVNKGIDIPSHHLVFDINEWRLTNQFPLIPIPRPHNSTRNTHFRGRGRGRSHNSRARTRGNPYRLPPPPYSGPNVGELGNSPASRRSESPHRSRSVTPIEQPMPMSLEADSSRF